MKLYTEEQVLKIIQKSVMDNPETYYEVLKHYTPIELPSDEEAGVIALNIASTLKDSLESREEAFYLAGFQTCAKWMRDKILNK